MKRKRLEEVRIFTKDKSVLFQIKTHKDETSFNKLKGNEWTGFAIKQQGEDNLHLFTGNKNGKGEQVIFV